MGFKPTTSVHLMVVVSIAWLCVVASCCLHGCAEIVFVVVVYCTDVLLFPAASILVVLLLLSLWCLAVFVLKLASWLTLAHLQKC